MTPNTAAANQAFIQPQLQKLGVRFVERSVEEITQLRQHLQDARAGDLAALHQVQQLAHRMHGTGAMFGFAAVGAGAEEIERVAERCAGSGAAVDAATFEQLLGCMARLDKELGRLATQLAQQ
jgi:HPt (histidine-containing phosphotransfer) domain-containing protein